MNPVVTRDPLAALALGGAAAAAPPSSAPACGVFALALDAALGQAAPAVGTSLTSPASSGAGAPRVASVPEPAPRPSIVELAVGEDVALDEAADAEGPPADPVAARAEPLEPSAEERHEDLIGPAAVLHAAAALVAPVIHAPESPSEPMPEPPPLGVEAAPVATAGSAPGADATAAPGTTEPPGTTRYDVRVDGATAAATAPDDAGLTPVEASPPADEEFELTPDAAPADRTVEPPAAPAPAREPERAGPADGGGFDADLPIDPVVAHADRPGELLAVAERNRLDGAAQQVDLEVDTVALGRVRVEAAEHGATLSIQIHAERPEARAMIERHLDGLHADLTSGRHDGSAGGEASARHDTAGAESGRAPAHDTAVRRTGRGAAPDAVRALAHTASGVDLYA